MSCPTSIKVQVGDQIRDNFSILTNRVEESCLRTECQLSLNGLNLLTEVTQILFEHTVQGVDRFSLLRAVDQNEQAAELCKDRIISVDGAVCESCSETACVLNIFAEPNIPVDLLPLFLNVFSCDANVTKPPTILDPEPPEEIKRNQLSLQILLIASISVCCCFLLTLYLCYNRVKKRERQRAVNLFELKQKSSRLLVIKKRSSILPLNRQLSGGNETVSTVRSLYNQAVYKKVNGRSSNNETHLVNSPTQSRHRSHGNETVSTTKSFLFQPINRQGSQSNSVMTFKTTSSYKSCATRLDEINFNRIKAVNSSHKKKLLKLSKLIWKKIPKHKTEEEYLEEVLTKILPFIVRSNKEFAGNTNFKEFSFDEEPFFELDDYLFKLMQGLNEWYHKYEKKKSIDIGPRCLILALLYVDKLKAKFSEFRLNKYNAHCIFAMLMLISAKFTEDELITNKYWAVVSGLEIEEVSRLEVILCFKIDFEFSIATETLAKILPALTAS